MVEFYTPQVAPTTRQAGQVSNAPAQQLAEAGQAAQGTANRFTEHYENQAAIQRDLLTAQAQADWTRTFAERGKNAGRGFTESIMAEYEEYVAGAMARYGEGMSGNIGQRGRDQLAANFQRYGISLQEKAMRREAAAAAAASARARAEADRLRANAIISDPSLLEENLEGATQAQRELFIKAALSARIDADPEGVLEEVMGGAWDADLTPAQKLSYMNNARSGIDRNARAAEVANNQARSELADVMSEEIAYAEANGAPPPSSNTREQIVDTFGADAAEVLAQYDASVALAHDVSVVSRSTPEEISFVMSELTAAVNEPGHTPADVSRLQTYQNALAVRNEQITEDPGGFVARTNTAAGEAWRAYSEAAPEDQAAAAQRFANAANFTLEQLGVPAEQRAVLPKAAATQMVTQFQTVGADVAPQMLRDFAQSWGSSAPAVIEQLAREGLAPEYVEAMRYADNPALSASIAGLAGVSDTDLRENIPTANVTEAGRGFAEVIAPYMQAFEAGGGPQAALIINRTAGVAERLILREMRNGVTPEAAIEGVMAKMFPETPVNTSRAHVLLPEGLRERDFSLATERAQDELPNFVPLDDPRFPDFVDVEVSRTALQDRGVWLNNSDGTGAVLHYNIGGYLLPAEVEGGGFFEVKFADVVPNTGGWRRGSTTGWGSR